MNKYLVLDIDGVCRDSVKYVCDKYGISLPEGYDTKVNGKLFGELIDAEVSENAPPTKYFKCLSLFSVLSKYQLQDKIYISDNPFIDVNYRWLKKHDVFFSNYIPALFFTKLEIVQQIINVRSPSVIIIVEDCFDVIKTYINELILPIDSDVRFLLINQPYNQDIAYAGKYDRIYTSLDFVTFLTHCEYKKEVKIENC